MRYCSEECQGRGWFDGHMLSCDMLRERREAVPRNVPEVLGVP